MGMWERKRLLALLSPHVDNYAVCSCHQKSRKSGRLFVLFIYFHVFPSYDIRPVFLLMLCETVRFFWDLVPYTEGRSYERLDDGDGTWGSPQSGAGCDIVCD